MAKKRQKDFQPVKLKPGRRVTKAANKTETRFKAKKITMPSTKVKSKNQLTGTISDCMKIVKENAHLATRRKALIDLNQLILKDPESLTSHLSDVLEHVLRLILDMEASLRNAALEVIKTVLTHTTDLQLQSFIPLFVNIISCCMTHTNLKIKEHSLTLLLILLKHHPSLICHSMDILNHLLKMLTGAPQMPNSTQPKSKNVAMLYSEDIYSPDWRIHILNHIHMFLKEMSKKKLAKQDDNLDEQEVYWDSSKGPLYLQIYGESGLKPFDIEKYYCDSSQEISEDSEQFLMFLENIVKTLPSVFIEEIAVEKKCDDNTYDFGTIRNINVVFQIFCSVSELLQSKNMDHLDESIRKFLKDYVYDKRRFPFSQKGAVFGKDEKAIVGIQLNLYVISLLCTYLSDSLKEKYFLDSVFGYMDFVYKLSSDLKYKCVPMIVKILNTFFLKKVASENSEFLDDSMTQLCSLLKFCDGDKDTKRMLLSFFTKMSLDPGYSFIGETDCMTNWFIWLLKELFEMSRTGNANKELLKLIKKIASRRYPCFQMCLEKIKFEHLLSLLKSDNDNICDAGIFLVYNMEYFDSNMLSIISTDISSDDGIPTLFAVKLIRMLTYRFYEKPERGGNIENSIHTGKGLLTLIQFLLNVALDSSSMTNPRFNSFDANEYAESLKIFDNVTSYIVMPSLHWKQHSTIFEVCVGYLNQLRQSVVHVVFERTFKEMLNHFRVFPMHSTIAIFKLMKRETRQKKKFKAQVSDLVFSSLLTVSILTSMSIDEDWYNYNVQELIKTMQLNSQLAFDVVRSMEFLEDDGFDSLAAYYMLRVCRYFVEKQLLDPDNFQTALECLELLREKCSDNTLGKQPLFVTLYSHFNYYASM